MDKKKLIRTASIVVISGIVVYIIINRIRKNIIYKKIMQEGARKEVYDPKKTTITDAQAETIANNLEKAFKPNFLGWGTDEQAVIDNLTGLTASDILLVEQKFGTRDDKNLRAYIRSEMDEDSKDFAKVRSIYQAVGLNL